MVTNKTSVKLTECPRDAMQGLHQFIPTEVKAAYINLLLQVGFDTIDFGSFVSPKAIPQMRDTANVLAKLNLNGNTSKLLAIIANQRGAEDAAQFDEISYLGFPFSISETFQQRNTNSSIDQSFDTVKKINTVCRTKGKELLIYLSMAFGNPYRDEWNAKIISFWTEKLVSEGIRIILLADTTGVSTPDKIGLIYTALYSRFPQAEFGVHLHSTPGTSIEKIKAAYQAGCKRFDSALKGFGGCPMASDSLTGNIATENLISFLQNQGVDLGLNLDQWTQAMNYSGNIFGSIPDRQAL